MGAPTWQCLLPRTPVAPHPDGTSFAGSSFVVYNPLPSPWENQLPGMNSRPVEHRLLRIDFTCTGR
jgi:hypothetical protein